MSLPADACPCTVTSPHGDLGTKQPPSCGNASSDSFPKYGHVVLIKSPPKLQLGFQEFEFPLCLPDCAAWRGGRAVGRLLHPCDGGTARWTLQGTPGGVQTERTAAEVTELISTRASSVPHLLHLLDKHPDINFPGDHRFKEQQPALSTQGTTTLRCFFLRPHLSRTRTQSLTKFNFSSLLQPQPDFLGHQQPCHTADLSRK